ncbi:unnamed protein product [Effrenium voratum]|nr:unnamed protein product [Effrenium voratum]
MKTVHQRRPQSLTHFLQLLNSFSDADKKVGIQAERENTYIKDQTLKDHHRQAARVKDPQRLSEEFLFVIKDWVKKCCSEGEVKSIDLQIPCLHPEVRVVLVDDVPREAPMPWDTLGEKAGFGRSRAAEGEVLPGIGLEAMAEREVTALMAVRLLSRLAQQLYGFIAARIQQLEEEPEQDGDGSCVDFAPQDVTLGPLEQAKLRLTAVPRREGLLQLRSVKWNLFDCDQVVCERPLQLKGRRLRATLEQRASRSGVYSTDLRLQVKVRARKPRLAARLEGWPDKGNGHPQLLQGQLHRCSLVLNADADCPLSFVQVATSHPNFVAFEPEHNSDVALRPEGLRLSKLSGELRIPVLVSVDLCGLHQLRLLVLAEAQGGGPDGPKSERQWITLEESLLVEPALSMTARPSPSYSAEGRIVFTCLVENRGSQDLEVDGMQCFSKGLLDLRSCGPGRQQVLQPGQSRDAPSVDLVAQWHCSGVVGEADGAEGSDDFSQVQKSSLLEWNHQEACALQVPLERLLDQRASGPEAPPCPLDLHLLAPEVAEAPDTMVPVTVRIRNASLAGAVSFYFVAESTADIAWVGCERSEVIRLPPNTSHTATVHAYFTQPGVYNLNRFRLYVVGMPSGSVPASEQAPLAFAVPFERLLHADPSN